MMDIATVKEFIESREGMRLDAYLDTKRIWTTGKGFNIERSGAKMALAAVGADYAQIWKTIRAAIDAGAKDPGDHTDAPVISAEQAERLFDSDIETTINDVRRIVPQLDKLPSDAQLVLIDMCYNMGPVSFAGFKRATIPAIVAGKYKKAAGFIAGSPYARDVGKRAERNCQILWRLGNGEHEP